jgi:hypothetical protein
MLQLRPPLTPNPEKGLAAKQGGKIAGSSNVLVHYACCVLLLTSKTHKNLAFVLAISIQDVNRSFFVGLPSQDIA